MDNYKGTGIVFLRTLLQKHGTEVEQQFLTRLTPEEVRIYHRTAEISWVPIALVSNFFEIGASMLCPDQPQNIGLRYIGIEMARNNLKGIYRVVLRLMTIPSLLQQSAKLWRIYHATGRAWMENSGKKAANFYVAEYPKLPERFRECLCGYIHGAVELTGGKEVNVKKDDNDTKGWKWMIRWG